MRLYVQNPSNIVKKISVQDKETMINIKGYDFILLPDVYPSHQFRTTDFLLTSISDFIKGKTLCDMGCGLGIIGQYALYHGAKYVVQADINPMAVQNALLNKELHKWKEQLQIFESNCFDNIPLQKFDIIIFNIPFHSENKIIEKPIELALFDPNFKSLISFLIKAKNYSKENTQIIIAFSNKGDINQLEALFDQYNYHWCLWRQINKDKKFDNRLYLLCLK